MSLDLFGEVETSTAPARPDRAHAWLPGTGPAGETCGSCGHCQGWEGGARVYYKCSLMPRTSGAATDVRLRDAACKRWISEVRP